MAGMPVTTKSASPSHLRCGAYQSRPPICRWTRSPAFRPGCDPKKPNGAISHEHAPAGPLIALTVVRSASNLPLAASSDKDTRQMTTAGSPPGPFSCDSGSLRAMLGDATLSCPCCNGKLTAEKLARLLSDVQKLAAAGGPVSSGPALQPAGSADRRYGMIIDSHAHMISRTTDDYEAMARAGVVAVIEPAFWLGQPRTNVGSFIDYFSLISGFERFRAGQFGIRHYCTIGLNPKEANNEALAEAVIDALPRFLAREGVVAMGELGYDEQTPLEDKALRAQIELAKEFELPIMIHTPHRDKRPGTLRTMDVLREHGFDPTRCVIDHNNEETIREVRDRGYWCAFSIYPNTKMGSERMATLVAIR